MCSTICVLPDVFYQYGFAIAQFCNQWVRYLIKIENRAIQTLIKNIARMICPYVLHTVFPIEFHLVYLMNTTNGVTTRPKVFQ